MNTKKYTECASFGPPALFCVEDDLVFFLEPLHKPWYHLKIIFGFCANILSRNCLIDLKIRILEFFICLFIHLFLFLTWVRTETLGTGDGAGGIYKNFTLGASQPEHFSCVLRFYLQERENTFWFYWNPLHLNLKIAHKRLLCNHLYNWKAYAQMTFIIIFSCYLFYNWKTYTRMIFIIITLCNIFWTGKRMLKWF